MFLLLKWFLEGSNLAQSRGICLQVVWQHSSAQITVRDKENSVFYLNLVYNTAENGFAESVQFHIVPLPNQYTGNWKVEI